MTACLDGWIPCRVDWSQPEPQVEWCYLGGRRLTDPLFEVTMQRQMEYPFRILFRQRTTFATLQERARTHPGVAPAGFIFHLSRCGSTLVSQMLAASERNVVVSEGGPLESILRRDADPAHIRAMLQAMAQPWGRTECRFFVKFDAWQIFAWPLIRQAYPDVPWIFVYRNPVEVLVSLLERPAMFIMPGMPLGGFIPVPFSEAASLALDEYAARILSAIAHTAIQALDKGGGVTVDYSQLPGAVTTGLAAHFHCRWSPAEASAMDAAGRRNAKRPAVEFVPDAGRKRQGAGPRVHELSARWLEPACRQLDTWRIAC